MNRLTYRYREQGATALVVVMFSVLLFAVVAVGFMQLMTSEQRSSTDNELSRGAYDSALAGIEDGKRVLKLCMDRDNNACDVLNADKCTTVSDAGFVTPRANGEVYLRSTSVNGLSGQDYEQAYTCVKVTLDTNDYRGTLSDDESVVIPLKTVGRDASQIAVSWFDSRTVDPSAGATDLLVKTAANWPSVKPPLLRIQLISLANGDDLSTLDNANGGRTLYVYPTTTGSALAIDSAIVTRARPDATATKLQAVRCQATGYLTEYACNTVITLPSTFATSSQGVYVRVSAIYNDTKFSVAPQESDGTAIAYDQVQPSIDSTGRASDVFRRVEARVETSDDQTAYPRATIDITGNLCKTVTVTDVFYDAGSCTP